MNWIVLIISLPNENASIRMRVWRAVKASGAAALRDGVYLLPERDSCHLSFTAIASDVQSGGGSTNLMRVESLDGRDFSGLFIRHEGYGLLLSEIEKIGAILMSTNNAQDVLKQLRRQRKTFAALVRIDFFPGEAQKQVDAVLMELELKANRILSPDEPHAVELDIANLSISDYQGRLWVTRQRPWVDRLASAWLIRRFIDPQARFVWLASIADCPPDALGFDFDGASFSHIGSRVTFEVLLASFALDQPGLKRLAALVHYLDVGGIQTPEACGIETVLAGLQDAINDDDQLLVSASAVFDSLLVVFDKGVSAA
jgi:hypothetical protein